MAIAPDPAAAAPVAAAPPRPRTVEDEPCPRSRAPTARPSPGGGSSPPPMPGPTRPRWSPPDGSSPRWSRPSLSSSSSWPRSRPSPPAASPSVRPSTTPRPPPTSSPRPSSPRCSPTSLLDGADGAAAPLDRVVRDVVIGDEIVRVKIWAPDGTIVYADEGHLIGRTFPLSQDQRDALADPRTIAEVSQARPDRERVRDGQPPPRGLPTGVDPDGPRDALRDLHGIRRRERAGR